jgi:hypothetical protein
VQAQSKAVAVCGSGSGFGHCWIFSSESTLSPHEGASKGRLGFLFLILIFFLIPQSGMGIKIKNKIKIKMIKNPAQCRTLGVAEGKNRGGFAPPRHGESRRFIVTGYLSSGILIP